MNSDRTSFFRRRFVLFAGVSSLIGSSLRLAAQDQEDFPRGYDAAEAAPQSHKVFFENRIVRVLEVTVPPGGRNRCIIIDGRASFSIGMLVAALRTNAFTMLWAASTIFRARRNRLSRASGM